MRRPQSPAYRLIRGLPASLPRDPQRTPRPWPIPPNPPRLPSMFNDRARIHVQAGRGGNGALSFRREKFVPKGGPDGGDGGEGGDVVFVADPDLRDLSRFRPNQWIRGGRGGAGGGGNRHGANGETVELEVPVGTQVFDESGQLIADLARPGARVIAARGGAGGGGNRRFVSPTRQT